MPDDDHTAAHRKVEAARNFCLGWLDRLGDLMTADEAYDNDMLKIERELNAGKEKIRTPGLDPDEITRTTERMLELRVLHRDMETSRDSTSYSRNKAHSELRRAQLKDLVDGVKGIVGKMSWVTASSRQVELPAPEQGNQHAQPGTRQAQLPTLKPDHKDLEKLQRSDGNSKCTHSETPSALRDNSDMGRPPLEKENPSPSSNPSNSAQPPPTPPVRPTPETVLSPGRRSAPKRRAAVESDNARRAGLGGTTAEIANESPSRPIKRRRMDDHPDDEEELVDLPSEPRPEPGSFAKRAIHYDDVHQNGYAKYRHFIVEYKGKYYICICEVHGLHFKGDILRGVGTHINSPKHNCGSRSFSVALEALGVQVLGCNGTLADKHNRMLTAAIEKREYTVLDWCNLPREQQEQIPLSSCGLAALQRSGTEFRKRGGGTTSPHSKAGTTSSRAKLANTASRPKGRRASQTQRGFKGVTDAVPGKPYFGQRSNGTWCGLIALPRGEVFGDPSFEEIGFPSALAGTQVLRTVPGCYAYSRFQRRYLGWDEGFEDGGASVTRREFPVIFFDGRPFPSQSQVAWISAQDLRPYDLMGSNAVDVPNLHSFGKLLKERRNKHKDEIEVEGDEDDEDSNEDDEDEDEDEDESADGSDIGHGEEKQQEKGKEKENKGGARKNVGNGGRQRSQATDGPTKETTRGQRPSPLPSGIGSGSPLPLAKSVQPPPQSKGTRETKTRSTPPENQDASASASRVPPVQPAQASQKSNHKDGLARVSSILSPFPDSGSDRSSPRPGQPAQPPRHPAIQQGTPGTPQGDPASAGQGKSIQDRRGSDARVSKPAQRSTPKGGCASDEPPIIRSDISDINRKPLPQLTGSAGKPATGPARTVLNRPLKAFKAASKATPGRATPTPGAKGTPSAMMPSPTLASAPGPAVNTNRGGPLEAHFIVSQSSTPRQGHGNRPLASTPTSGPAQPVNKGGWQAFRFAGSQFDTTREVHGNDSLSNEHASSKGPKPSQAVAPLSPNPFPPNVQPHTFTPTPGNRAGVQWSTQKTKQQSHGLGPAQKTTNPATSSANSGASRNTSPLVSGQPGVRKSSEPVSVASTSSKPVTPRPPNSVPSAQGGLP